MRITLKLLSFLGLGLTVCPPVFYFFAKLNLTACHQLMTVGMVIWFVSAPFWINSDK